ncbi:MAG: glycosyl transferase [Pseudomonadota bacterium]|nr:glycosyl transferase [Pseudomonadota bacterium]
MSDFIQNSEITTLQLLRNRPLMEIEAELEIFSYDRKITLLLPALYSEFEGPAMPKIISHLSTIPYIHRIVLSLDRADRQQFESVKKQFEGFPCDVKIIWQDSPEIVETYRYLESQGFNVASQGKGRGVWFSIGYILGKRDSKVIALHDCDIVNYDRLLPARLIYPLVHPSLAYDFSKGYYARVSNDELYGRVNRLYVMPMLMALSKIFGKLSFLEYLQSFRYTLSGEFAMSTDMALKLRIAPDWGLEIATLGELHSLATPIRICQVELMDNYEHKHQTLSPDSDRGLKKMVHDITCTLFRILSQDGLIFTPSVFRTLRVTYINFARLAIERYHALAQINGLRFNRHGEISAVEIFSAAMGEAVEKFMENPLGTPLLAAWQRVIAADPDFDSRLVELIDEMND